MIFFSPGLFQLFPTCFISCPPPIYSQHSNPSGAFKTASSQLKTLPWGVPWWPRTLHFHRWGPGSIPGQELKPCMPQGMANRTKNPSDIPCHHLESKLTASEWPSQRMYSSPLLPSPLCAWLVLPEPHQPLRSGRCGTPDSGPLQQPGQPAASLQGLLPAQHPCLSASTLGAPTPSSSLQFAPQGHSLDTQNHLHISVCIPPQLEMQVALVVKNPPANTGDARRRVNAWVRRSPGGGHGNPRQYSCLENPMDREAWEARLHGVAKSRTQLK